MRWIAILIFFIFASNLSAQSVKNKYKKETIKDIIKKKNITPFVEAGSKTSKENGKTDFQKYEEDIEFGISKKRIFVVEEIIKKKDKQFYPLLERILKNEIQETVILRAILAVKTLQLKEYSDLIVQKIDTNNNDLKIVIIETIGEFEDVKYEANILEIMKVKENEWLKRSCITALGKMKSQKALGEFYKIFNNPDSNSETKVAVLSAIGYIKDESSIPFLEEVIEKKSNSAILRAYSAKALATIGGKKAFSIMEKYINDPEIMVVTAIIEGLGNLKTPEAYTYVYQCLKHDTTTIRYAALKAIQKFDNPKSFMILKYMIYNDDDYKVKLKAVEVLSKIGGHEAEKLWEKELINNFTGLKMQIINNMHYLSKENSIKILVKSFVKNNDIKIRKKIIEKMFEIDTNEALKLVDKRIMNQSDAKYLPLMLDSIMLIFKNLGEKSIPVYEKYLSHQNAHVRRYTYFYLLGINSSDSYEKVFQFLKDEQNKDIIIYIIKLFKERKLKTSIPVLEHIRKSFNPEIRKEANEIITYLKAI
ncbi:MAG: HEAT repeat domain-containing protein [Spirochaetota bacterium]|nr:HEAT repeat domain-containing protein [Spirochaetota bacterium]